MKDIQIRDYFTEKELAGFKERLISDATIKQQLNCFVNGVAPSEITEAATTHNATIAQIANIEKDIKRYEDIKNQLSIVKFVPASGAASRMFKDFFEFLETDKLTPEIENFVKNIEKLAFYDDLKIIAKQNNINIENEIKNKNYKEIIRLIVAQNGLNYGSLPKGLLKFHKYENENRTALEEHIVEAIEYAEAKNIVKLHFTISEQFEPNFKKTVEELKSKYNKHNLEINFSSQMASTDTFAFTLDNKPYFDSNKKLFFRPGGHGALIHNLNKISADIIFIKNIDNVTKDTQKELNGRYKKALAGILLKRQQEIFNYIEKLKENPTEKDIDEVCNSLKTSLLIKINFDFEKLSQSEKIEFLLKKLDRPIRVCAMVKNEGEPGGGPFFVRQKDDTITLQIVEKAQIDLSQPNNQDIFKKSSHFNPVDIVCSPKRFNGEKFNLIDFIDHETAFISEKTKQSDRIKVLELPGLWNGAMADWNTIFVEVPIETFNPVKTVFDLLNRRK